MPATQRPSPLLARPDDSALLLRPATPLQAGMYFHNVAHMGAGVDVEHVIMTAEESLDLDRFFAAWTDVLSAHPELCAIVRLVDGRPWIVANPAEPFSVEQHDLRTSTNADEESQRIYDADRARGFDLAAGPLMRFTTVRTSETQTAILWSFHHLLLDGRSFPLVLERVLAHYNGDAELAPAKATMGDYANALAAIDHTDAKGIWAQKLAGLDGPSSIPSTISPDASGVLALEERLGAEVSACVRALAAASSVSVHNVIQAAWALLVHHHSQKSSVVFGSTRAGRHVVDDADDAIGLFILTVPFRVEFDQDLTTSQLLANVRDEQRALRSLETVPLDQIQQASGFGATPLFDSLVMFDDATLNNRMAQRLGGRSSAWSFDYVGQTNFPLTLLAYGEDDIILRLEHDTARYDTESATAIISRLKNLLTSMVSEPDAPAVTLPYLTDADSARLAEWNATDNEWDRSSSLCDLLEAQALKTPDAPAVSFGDRSYTYAEFDRLVLGLGHHLRSLGVGRGVLVGVAAERSIELELAIHAIVRAGGGFVPLDPSLPDERLAGMAEGAGITMVLSQPAFADRPAFDNIDVLVVDLENPTWDVSVTWEIDHRPFPRDLAYALFTSGSTGKPKCAANEHRGIVNRLRWMQEAFPLDDSDVVLQKTPYSFDVSVWEHFWPLCVGAQLVIAAPGAHHDPRVLAHTIAEKNVTTVHFVPSMLQLFVEEPAIAQCTSLRRIIASGEALPRPLQDKVFAALDAELHNLYGPTEAAIDVTWWACEPDSPLSTIPIGSAISNTQIRILDAAQQQVPPGVAGELYIGGVQVGRGYVNRPDLTADRFLPDPFNEGEKIYKTGDLARFMADGNVEYLGRLDHQVKVRGQRIELGEIEVVIGAHPAVRETVVMAREDQPGIQTLVGYVVASDFDTDAATTEFKEDIKEHCAKVLPSYMIPDHWVPLDALPLNTSGKVDRKKLPAPAVTRRQTGALESDAERRVGAIWIDILDHDAIAPTDSFFEVGGTSLELVRLAVALGDAVGREVPVVDLFKQSTIRQQASYLFDKTAVDNTEDEPDEAIARSKAQADARRSARPRRRPTNR